MEYEQRLVAAAEFVLSGDRRAEGHPTLDPADFGVTATLKPHQVEGVSWLVRRYMTGVNVVLGDEMGLGKTLQAISFLSYLKSHLSSPGPFLILCPLSVTDGWASEFAKFCPVLKVLRYVGEKEFRRSLRRTLYEHVHQSPSSYEGDLAFPFDVMLTTYDIAMLDQDFLSQIPWQYAVIDEAQRLKNPTSVLYTVLEQQYLIPRRLLMTGTPIQNNLSELWALMHFCMPAIFGTLEQFVSTFKEVRTSSANIDAPEAKGQVKILKYILKAFMLRRTKSLLIENGTLMLPPLTEVTVMVPLVPLQKKVYVSILRKELPKLLALTMGPSNHQSLQNIVIQLRKACSHPYLFNGIEPEPYEEGEHLVMASGKLVVLDQLLQKLHRSGHRVLLFAQMTHTLDVLQDFLELRRYSYERLDGSVRAEERFSAIRSFSVQSVKNLEKNVEECNGAFIFMISTRAGGTGLNLVAADTVIFYEQDWNPQVDKQALQRAHRIGQINHVLAINLITERTIEEVIMRRAERKLQLSYKVVGGESDIHEDASEHAADVSDVRSLILGLHVFDPTDIGNGDITGVNMAELDTMTDKVVETRDHEISEKDVQRFEINPTDLLSRAELSTSISFDSGLDEASYLSWVEKFKVASQSIDDSALEMKMRRNVFEDKHVKRENEVKKAEQKKLAKWEALGYQSLTVKDPVSQPEAGLMSDLGSVQFVYGDCTKPSKVCPSEATVIFSCVDTSGHWGHGGMFDALANLSTNIPDAYHRAFECGDLRLGDLHLIKLNGISHDNSAVNIPHFVALAVVQSYNPRRKVPRSNISMTDLERCLSKACFSAAENSASIHMPRIGYQGASEHSEWYTVERLLRKYASIYAIKIFVYYFRRPSQE
uniref:Chromodomain-helicase-DNA-binding protein 1-like n=1 Tax=Anthurium amnicola TaxID=1678845 RepID=A0A1D1YTL9_9ARAE